MKTWRTKALAEARELHEHYRVLLIFGGMYNRDVKDRLERGLARLESLTRREIDATLRRIRTDCQRLRKVLRPTRPISDLIQFLDDSQLQPTHLLYVPRWFLRENFAGIEDVDPTIRAVPEHARFSFDVQGELPPGHPGEVRILEAALFEDMCATFNRAWQLEAESLQCSPPKAILKEAAAMRRAAALNSFYMVEAYLNSIAFDHLVRHGKDLPQSSIDFLSEWDSEKNRERLVSFRGKLLGYPKTILALPHPPLQENNCPPISYLLSIAKDFRDAIVHANPRLDVETYVPEKEIRFWTVGKSAQEQGLHRFGKLQADWVRIVDTGILVVEAIENVVHGSTDRLFWLKRRSVEGPFSADVFD